LLAGVVTGWDGTGRSRSCDATGWGYAILFKISAGLFKAGLFKTTPA